MKKLLLLATSILLPILASAQMQGTVYFDANQNGIQDASEKGLNGVAVSDGKSVVKTDASGAFKLSDNSAARFVSVTTPSGYTSGHRHYLNVTPDTENYDFGLVRNENSTGAFEFIHVTDSETHNTKGGWLENLKEYVKTNPTAFIVHTGDICYIPGLDFHGTNVRTEHMGVPTYYTLGNHDLVDGDYGEQHYEKHFGPSWHSFDVGNVHFMVLPMLGGDRKPSYNKKQILDWIKADLTQVDPAKKVIMLNHDLWFQGDDLVIRADGDSIDMKDHNLVAFLYGHWHIQFAKEVAGMMTYSTSSPNKGGIDHSPACFRVLSIDADGNITDKNRSRYTNINGTLTASLPAQHDTLSTVNGTIPVRVNAYRTVSPTSMVRVGLVEGGKRGRMVTLTQQTDWAWSGRLGVGNKTGVRNMVIESNFADGSQLVEQRSFVVTNQQAEVIVGADWGNLGGNAGHSGVVADRNALSSPRYVWSQNAGSNIFMVSPIVGGGKVFVATADDDNLKNCHVVAYDATTGKELWRYKTDNSVKGTMVYSDGLVLACDATMRLYAINAQSGELAWSKNLSRGMLPESLHGLAVTDGVVYAGQSSGFSALKVKDGTVVWRNEEWSGGEGTQSTATVGAGVALASAHWNGLYAHDVKDGKMLWKKRDSKIRFRDGSATIYDDLIYLASGNGLFLINPKSGDVLKSVIHDNVSFNAATAPVVTKDMIYLGTADKGVMAYDRLTFKQVWNYRTKPAIFYTVPYSQDFHSSVETSPVLIGNTLVFGASDGYMYGLNAQSGVYQWSRNMGAPIFSSPAVSGDALYVADFSGNIYCFKINN